MNEREVCETCGRPIANEADWEEIPNPEETEGAEDLCWGSCEPISKDWFMEAQRLRDALENTLNDLKAGIYTEEIITDIESVLEEE